MTLSAPQLVMPQSPLAETIPAFEARWRREFGGEVFPWDEAWVWGSTDGYALFTRSAKLGSVSGLMGGSTIVGHYWSLDRVWFRPELRRRGLLTAVWSTWEERYGEIHVAAPGADMQAFLRSACGPLVDQ